ncbi:uncharacterized protein LOC112345293 [Selaginella moellendorffii]|uniref:uncharacterized protein LOC112345293 n=1 Tax=Selaginella moellendorffii TaxID=88036 RepID=UPI000D1CD6E7|nr:uncharacterized protein LOC112345293 [Selaginella moellendorffii]|eukprot:XP_024527470.1 uncharacterized protein LOC112345293 [Selaginella moellendorffii]
MHTATVQGGGAPSKSTSSPSQPKLDASQNAGGSLTPNKSKKRERIESSNEANKRERSVNLEDGDSKSDQTVEEFGGIDKDGLTSVAGVEKLVTAMQQDRSDGSKKPAYCANKRTVLSAAILATENHEYLDRFVQLGGVALFHEWLQEAYKGKSGDGESPREAIKGVEELLLTILSALEKLPVDLQALRCQVGKSVNNLKSHKNLEIKEKARKLVETWKKRVGDEMNSSGGAKAAGHGSAWSTTLKNPMNVSPSDVASQTAGANGASVTKLKSEKGTNQPQHSNGQPYNNAIAGSITWKDDAKSSSGSKSNSSNHRHNKGSATKETTVGKPLTWAREKGEPEPSTKVVLRLPRSSSLGANEEVFGPGSQGSSPSLPDQTAVSSIAEAPDVRQRLHGPNDGKEDVENNQAGAENKSEVSRTSDSNDRAAVSMAIIPVSAISRISGDAAVGASGRSTIMSEIGTVDQEVAGSTADRISVENHHVPSESKEEARRKDAHDGVDGANCASSSSFTEMSVDLKGQGDEARDAMSSAVDESHVGENARPRQELEGLGESPEPRCNTSQTLRRPDDHTKPADTYLQSEKRDTPSPNGAVSGRGSYEGGPGRGLESWAEKRNSFFLGKNSSSEESRKNAAEQGKGTSQQDTKIVESTSEFEDDALEVAQQIAKEVEQEVETSHLSSEDRDAKLHLLSTVKDPDSSPRHLLERCSLASVSMQENQEPGDSKAADGNEDTTVSDQAAGTEAAGGHVESPEHSPEALNGSTQGGNEKPGPALDASDLKAEEEKPAEAAGLSRPDFDLNEGLGGDEGFKDVSCAPVLNLIASAALPTTPIPVLPTTKGAYVPPESLRKSKSETGWKGSAATSAFRPAEPRRANETVQQQHQQDAGEIKQTRQPLDIDLNIADESTGFENSFVSKPFAAVKASASTSGRADFDLNCADDCEDGRGMGLDMKVHSSGQSRTAAAGAAEASTRGMARDFDLNGPVDDEEPSTLVQHMSLRSTENSNANNSAASLGPAAAVPSGFRMGGDLVGVAPWFPPGNSFSAVAIPALPMARAAEASYQVPTQPFLNAGGGAIHFNMDLYRGGMTLATPAVAYPGSAPVPYPYAAAGFPFSNYSFNASSSAFPASSFVEAPGPAPPQYQAAVSSQIGGGPGAMSRFIRPHLMGIADAGRAGDGGGGVGVGVGGGGGSAWTRQSLDLNTGPEVVADDLRRGVPLEDHLRGFGQVATQAGKRKEPESGCDAFQANYKQPAWC